MTALLLSLCLVFNGPLLSGEVPVQPVNLKITGTDKVDPYKLVRLTVEGVPSGYTILWDVYPIDGVDSATQKLKSVYEFVAPPGVYKARVRAFKGEDVLEAWYPLTIGGTIVPPPKKPTDPVDPPPTTGKYFFVVVRPDGPASPEFTKAMSLPEWTTLRTAGHKYKDKTISAAKADLDLEIPAGTVMPTVITLSVENGKSVIVRGPTPLPADGPGVLKLTEGIK